MKRGKAVKKVTLKAKKKELEDKVRKALNAPGKTIKKKETKGKPKAVKNAPAKKVKTGFEKKRKAKKAGITEKGKERQKKRVKTISVKPVKQTKKDQKKPIKKLKEKIREKAPYRKIGTIKPVKPKRKSPGRIVVKPATRPEKKIVVKTKKERPQKVIKKVAGKVEKKVAPAKPKKTPAPEAIKKVKEVRKVKAVKAIKKAKEITIKEVKRAREGKEIREGKRGYPPVEMLPPRLTQEPLPAEYGENSIALMTVDPFRLFSYWEVRKDTLRIFKGDLAVRLYDVTGIDLDRMDANSFWDIGLHQRIGSLYLDVGPEREFIADIGILYDGIFITIARSPRVSTPRVAVTGEGVLPPICYATEIRVGY